jgi:hypothetical protein
MKENHNRKSRSGGIAIGLLLVMMSLSTLVGSYVFLTTNNTYLTGRAIDHQKARIATESALDSARSQISAILKETGSIGALSSKIDNGEVIRPLPIGDYWIRHFDVTNLSAQASSGSMDIQISAKARNLRTGMEAAMQQVVRVKGMPFVRYAYFYDDVLQLFPVPDMIVNGDMWSNTRIELWTSDDLYLKGRVETPGSIHVTPGPWNKGRDAASRIYVDVGNNEEVSFRNADDEVIDSRHEDFASIAPTRWNRRVRDGSLGAEEITPPIATDDYHTLIEPIDPADTEDLQREKLAHKASVYITVSADGKTVNVNGFDYLVKEHATTTGEKDASTGTYETDDDKWFNVHTDIADTREAEGHENLRMIDIYLDKFLESPKYAGTDIVYVEMKDPDDNEFRPAVRLRNGYDLGNSSEAGLSIATDRSLFVEGEYNTATTADGQSKKVPALLA